MRVDKAELRRQLLTRLRAQPAEERAEKSARVARALAAALPAEGLIAAYLALPAEVQLGALCEALGDRLVLPRVSPQGLRLHRAAGARVRGQLGVMEPHPDSPEVALGELSLILVPGLAFTSNGERLGRGKGHYDRLLARRSCPAWGVAFGFQVLPTLPTEPHDQRLDAVFTEEGRAAATGRA